MDEYEERAYQYRQRAEELRAILPDMKDPHTRETVERIIRGYDKLAIAQDRLSQENKANAEP